MKHTDISLIEQLLAANNFGDSVAVKHLFNKLSPEIKPLLETYIPNHCSQNIPPIIQAWSAYRERKWDKALALFNLTLSSDSSKGSTALGIGLIAIKYGEWKVAQQWLGNAIFESRKVYNDFLLMKCHGAMGELMLRTQNYHSSLQHMQLAYALCPAGHPQRQRHYSYISMPLARLGKCSVAEGYYMSGYYLAMDKQDYISALHALVRRAALMLYNYDVSLDDIKVLMDDINKDNNFKYHGSHITSDYFNIVSFWHEWKQTGNKNMILLENLFKGSPWELHVVDSIKGSAERSPQLSFPQVPSNLHQIHLRSASMKNTCSMTEIKSAEKLQEYLKTFFI